MADKTEVYTTRYLLARNDAGAPSMLVRVRQNGSAWIERLVKGKWVDDPGALEDAYNVGAEPISESEALKIEL